MPTFKLRITGPDLRRAGEILAGLGIDHYGPAFVSQRDGTEETQVGCLTAIIEAATAENALKRVRERLPDCDVTLITDRPL